MKTNYEVEKYRVRSGYRIKEAAGEFLAVPVGDNSHKDGVQRVIILSESGKALWEAMEEAASLDELTQVLTSRYEVDRETARADIIEFLQSMEKEALLEIV